MNDDPRSGVRRAGQPTPIGELLGRAQGQSLLRAAATVLELRKAWPEIAGAVLAERSEPAAIAGRKLIVYVTSNVWLSEFNFVKLELLERLQQAIPAAGLNELVGRVGPLSSEIEGPA